MDQQYLCDSCRKPTLGQRFCPVCGTIQKQAKIEGVAAATAQPQRAPTAGPGGTGSPAAKAKAAPVKAVKAAAAAAAPAGAAKLAPEKVKELFERAIEENVDGQAMTFLRAFVVEFQGSFEEVLNLAEMFKSFGEKAQQSTLSALDQFQAHRFLESRGDARTAADLRATLQFIDLRSKGSLSFLEYLLVNYKKRPHELFEESTDRSPELLRKLEEVSRVFQEKREREDKMAELTEKAAAGDVKAKSELKRMQMEDPAKAKDEAAALHAKLAAKRALANPVDDKARLLEEEQKRLAEEKARQEAEEKRKKAESKKRLAEKASLWK